MNYKDVEDKILDNFHKNPGNKTAIEVYEEIGHRYGEKAVRKALKQLVHYKVLAYSRYQHNLCKYRLASMPHEFYTLEKIEAEKNKNETLP
jgi:hypothetical protein